MRENLDGNLKELILSYAHPFKPINSQSVAKYIKRFLAMAGIDITVFTTHSVRSASTSKANNRVFNIYKKQLVGKVAAHFESTISCQ